LKQNIDAEGDDRNQTRGIDHRPFFGDRHGGPGRRGGDVSPLNDFRVIATYDF